MGGGSRRGEAKLAHAQASAPVKRARLAPEARRAQLIELGVEMLATRRLDELSVELIAQKAGISRGLLFHYFASKQEFHLEVARAAAAEMLRRTAPVAELPPVEALRAALAAYVDYVEENPDNYKSLVRGAASGDQQMRAVFDQTRTALAERIVDFAAAGAGQGVDLGPQVTLAIHGWVAFAEECVIRWIDTRTVDRSALLDLLTRSLPAVVLSAAGEELPALLTVFAAEGAGGS
jgi:AcrR family transcriptional regulator